MRSILSVINDTNNCVQEDQYSSSATLVNCKDYLIWVVYDSLHRYFIILIKSGNSVHKK
jgi:hypothetical protein